jgi:hypothetical protein
MPDISTTYRLDLQGELEIKQGATYQLGLYYVTSAGAAIDITGYSARMTLRSDYEATTSLLDLTSPSAGLVITGASGLVTVTITSTQTAALTAGPFVWDIEIVSAGGVVTRMAGGVGVISREVTR